MKTLSIRQPWAYLIIHGPLNKDMDPKDIENRSRRTNYRGPFNVHASKKIDIEAYNILTDAGIELPPIDKLQTGGIIGRSEIVDCVDDDPSPWFMGDYGYKLRNSKPLPFKRCLGQLGFFEVS